jgi:hypothetical protein
MKCAAIKESLNIVIPAKAGIQSTLISLDSGFRRSDEMDLFRASLKVPQ